MSKFKSGDTIKILNVEGIGGAKFEGYKNNETVKLVKFDDMLALPGLTSTTPLVITKNELQYIELVKKKKTRKQRIKALEKRVTELESIIRGNRAEDPTPIELSSSIDKLVEGLEKAAEIKTSNQLRAEIIEKAIRFVDTKEHYLQNSPGCVGGYETKQKENPHFAEYIAETEYIINKDKRTVVSLLKCYDGTVLSRGIAKCDPSDVYNKHIGKAIALGRALKLDVSEFENAVQPTLAVGQEIQVVYYSGELSGMFRTVKGIKNGCATYNEGSCSIYKIEDDTNAVYGG